MSLSYTQEIQCDESHIFLGRTYIDLNAKEGTRFDEPVHALCEYVSDVERRPAHLDL